MVMYFVRGSSVVRRLLFAFSTVIVLVAGPGRAGVVSAGTSPELLSSGSITGSVEAADSGDPLTGLSIAVYDSSGDTVGSASVNPDGTWSYSGLPAGTYYARTSSADGYVSQLYSGVDLSVDVPVTEGDPIVVEEGGTTSGVDFVLATSAVMTGTVTSAATGSPLPGVTVSSHRPDGSIRGDVSDASGVWVVDRDLGSGTHYAYVSSSDPAGHLKQVFDGVACPGGVCDPEGDGTPIAVVAGATTSNIDFELEPATILTGTVTRQDSGAPVPAARVNITDEEGRYLGGTYSNGLGTWRVSWDIPGGIYHANTFFVERLIDEVFDDIDCQSCDPTIGTPIDVVKGATTGGIDFTLRPGGLVSGTVTDSITGLPLSNVEVYVIDGEGEVIDLGASDGDGVWISQYSVTTGSYFARTVRTAGYLDELYLDSPCDPGCEETTGTPIAVTEALTTTGIDFSLDPSGVLTGVVTSAETGDPIADVRVEVHDHLGASVGYGRTDAAGAWRLGDGLATGVYYVRTVDVRGYFDELYDGFPCEGGCDVTSGTPVSVSIGQTSAGIDFVLERDETVGGTITGAPSGAPLAGVEVRVYDAGGSLVASATSGEGGSWHLHATLPDGTYFARTVSAPGYLDQLYDGISCAAGCTVTEGTPIEVAAGVTTPSIDFELDPSAVLGGLVTDEISGLPLDHANVWVHDAGGSLVEPVWTGGDGSWEVGANLPAGTYFARTASVSGYLDELYDDHRCPWGCTVTNGTPIVVTVGERRDDIDFALQPAVTLSGTVSDAYTGQPIEGAWVQVKDSLGGHIATLSTNASGVYSGSEYFAPGTYYLLGSASGYFMELYDDIECADGCDPTTGTPVVLVAGSPGSGYDFELVPSGKVSGYVMDEVTGLPLASVQVRVYDGAGGGMGSDVSDSDGYWEVAGLDDGTYFARTYGPVTHIDELYDDISCFGGCEVIDGTPIVVSMGSDVSGVDFVLEPKGAISGTITDAISGLPIEGAGVAIHSTSGDWAGWAASDDAGVWITDGLVAGSYVARTSGVAHYFDELYDDIDCSAGCDVTTGDPITVTAGSTTSGIDFDLVPTATITGVVTDAITGLPVGDVLVIAYDEEGDAVASAGTETDGAYAIVDNLVGGTYYVRSAYAEGYFDELYGGIHCSWGCEVTSGTPVVVGPSGTADGIDIELDPCGIVSGTVTDAATTLPLADVRVHLYDAGGEWVGYDDTGVDGTWSLSNLATGTYFGWTWNDSGYLNELYDDISCTSGCDPTSGTGISVTEGAVTGGIDFALERSGVITGTVVDAFTALPLAGVRVVVSDQSGSTVGNAYSDDSGAWIQAENLASGTHYARTYLSSGYFDELYQELPCPSGCDETTGTPIAVIAGATTSGVAFTLDPSGRILGTVRENRWGTPLEGARIDVFDDSGAFVASAEADSDGDFVVADALDTAPYFARASAPGHTSQLYYGIDCPTGCDVTDGTQIDVTRGAATAGVDFFLMPRARISGTVVDAITGSPLAGHTVYILGSGPPTLQVEVQPDGTYSTDTELEPGMYYVAASGANAEGVTTHTSQLYDGIACPVSCQLDWGTPVEVYANEETAGIDFHLEPAGTITGRVVDSISGTTPSYCEVWVYDSGGTWLGFSMVWDATSGEYATLGLPPGDYFAVAGCPGYANQLYSGLDCPGWGGCDPLLGTPLTVTAGGVRAGVDFELVPEGRIEGTVADAVGGAPIAGASVRLYDVSGRFVMGRNSAGTGSFSFDRLSPGPYFLTARGGGRVNTLYDGIPCGAYCDPVSGTAVVVVSGATTGGVDFLLPEGGAVSGSVVDFQTGGPVPVETRITLYDTNGSYVASRLIDPDGGYTVGGDLATGGYFAVAIPQATYDRQLYDSIPYEVGDDVTSGTPIQVDLGLITDGVDFALTVEGLLFSDGFESGSTVRWSNAVGVTSTGLGEAD